VAEQQLVVPAVEAGDVGLVLAVHEVVWDRHLTRWWVVVAEGRLYRVPASLTAWAEELDSKVRRQVVRLPAVFAFRQSGGLMQVQMLSSGQRGEW
jgi:hypothetical protein